MIKSKKNIWTVKNGGGTIMLWGYFAAITNYVLHKVNKTMKNEFLSPTSNQQQDDWNLDTFRCSNRQRCNSYSLARQEGVIELTF